MPSATGTAQAKRLERCMRSTDPHFETKIERDVIARGVFTSVNNLRRKLMRSIKQYTKTAKPFRWAYANHEAYRMIAVHVVRQVPSFARGQLVTRGVHLAQAGGGCPPTQRRSATTARHLRSCVCRDDGSAHVCQAAIETYCGAVEAAGALLHTGCAEALIK